MKTGIVLEGGAMRGMYTAGVLDVLMEEGIYTDSMVGVSAGAVFGCNYKSRQIGRTIRYNCKYCRDHRYSGWRSLILTGNYFNEKFCYYDIPERLDPFDLETFRSSPMEFHVVVTDVITGKAVYRICPLGNGEDLLWMRASASLPLVSRVVKINGGKYLDGGLSDSIPLAYSQSIGCDKNVVVLTREKGYRKERSSLTLQRLVLGRYPELIRALERRHEMYNAQLDYVERCEREGSVLVIRPSQRPDVSRTEKDRAKLLALYELGRADCTSRLSELGTFLSGREL